MLRRVDEAFYHEPEAVASLLNVALGVLVDNDLDPATHDATLAAVLNLVASKNVVFEQVNPSVLGTLR